MTAPFRPPAGLTAGGSPSPSLQAMIVLGRSPRTRHWLLLGLCIATLGWLIHSQRGPSEYHLTYRIDLTNPDRGVAEVVLELSPAPSRSIELSTLMSDRCRSLEIRAAVGSDGTSWETSQSRVLRETGDSRSAFSSYSFSRPPSASSKTDSIRISYACSPGTIHVEIPSGEERHAGIIRRDMVVLHSTSLLLLPAAPVGDIAFQVTLPAGWRTLSTYPGRLASPHQEDLLDLALVAGNFAAVPKQAPSPPDIYDIYTSVAFSGDALAAASNVLEVLCECLPRGEPLTVLLIDRPPDGLRVQSPLASRVVVIDMEAPDVASLRELLRLAVPLRLGNTRNEAEATMSTNSWFLLGLTHFLSLYIPSALGYDNHNVLNSIEYTWMVEKANANVDLESIELYRGALIRRQIKATAIFGALHSELAESGGLAALLPRLDTAGFVQSDLKCGWGEPAYEALRYLREQGALGRNARLPFEARWSLKLSRQAPSWDPEVLQTCDLSLIFTANTVGHIENCGCRSFQSGGLSRRSAKLNELRAGGVDSIVVDIGNFFPVEANETRLDPIAVEEIGLYLDAMALMGYDAACVGAGEFYYGVPLFEEKAARAGFPIIGAQVRDSSGAISMPWTILQKHGVSIGIAAYADKVEQGWLNETLERNTAGLQRPIDLSVFLQQLEHLRTQVDLLVVCGALTPETLRRLAGAPLRIDIALSTLSPTFFSNMAAGRLGDMVVAFDRAGTSGVNLVRCSLGGRVHLKDAELHELPETAPRDESMDKLLNSFYDGIANRMELSSATTRTFVDDPAVQGPLVGVNACKTCHAVEYRQWRQTPHATAMQTLRSKHRGSNPACVQCHVLGLGHDGGFQLARPDSGLEGVQCEVCHGSGAAHLRDPLTFSMRRSPGREVCLQCHDEEHSEAFPLRFDEALTRVDHD